MPETGLTSRGVGSVGSGLLTILNNEQLDKREEAEKKRLADATKKQGEDEIIGLVAHINAVWDRNSQYRQESGIDERLIQALRQRENVYDPEKLSAIQAHGGSEAFMGVTGLKCRAGEAWLLDILSSLHDKSWTLQPTPIPDLPPDIQQGIVETTLIEVQQYVQATGLTVTPEQIRDYAAKVRDEIDDNVMAEAKDRAKRMEKKIHDQQIEGKFKSSFDDFITNLVTFPSAFIKGPIIRKKPKLSYDIQDGKTVVVVKDEITMEFETPSPFDMYPSRGAVDVNDGDLIELLNFSRKNLLDMKGSPHWDDETIDLVLSEYGEGGHQTSSPLDSERSILEDKGSDLNKENLISGFDYWGSVMGRTLLKEGITEDLEGNPIEPLNEYQINAIQIGKYLVYRDFNLDPLGERPYSKESWDKKPGSYWGRGVPELMRDIQGACNASARAIINNEAVGSGPQVIYNDVNRLATGEVITEVYPFKIHQFTGGHNSQIKPIEFYMPETNAAELLTVFKHFANMADDYTGIPAYAHGNDNVGGAGRTASGLSMLMSNAARGMKMVIGRVDANVINDVIYRQFVWNMMYEPDESIKGDIEIHARGTLAQIIKEQMTTRRLEFLNVTNNDTDHRLMGDEGRRVVLAEASSSLDLPTPAVKTKEEVEQMEQALQTQVAQAEATGAVADDQSAA